MQVYISLCTRGDINVYTAQAIAAALVGSGYKIAWGVEQDSLISRSRSVQATSFLWNRVFGDVLVFVDSDIRFSVEGFCHLVSGCLEGRDITCGMYVVRDTVTPHPALALFPGQRVKLDDRGEPVEIRYAATGFMAVHRRVLEAMAETLPLVFSGPRYFYPFFHELITEDGEFLSEDYSFCHRARQLGFKVWLDPRIRLSHEGVRSYVLEDLRADAWKQTVTMTVNEGGPDVTGVTEDLAEYWGKTREEVLELIRQTPFRTPIAEEWEALNPQTPEEVEAFYRNTDKYILELAKFNTSPEYWLRVYPASRLKGRIADFGGGIGTLALRLWRGGQEVIYIDLPSPHREFAEFRFRRHGAPIKVASSLQEVESSSLDAITATDVLEHIHPDRLPGVIAEMHRTLKPGGLVYCMNDFHRSDGLPEHYENEELFRDLMARTGFTKKGDYWVKEVGHG